MKGVNLEEVVRSNPLVDREKLEEALCMLKTLAEEGVAPVEARGGYRRGHRGRGAILPDAASQEHPRRTHSRHSRHR